MLDFNDRGDFDFVTISLMVILASLPGALVGFIAVFFAVVWGADPAIVTKVTAMKAAMLGFGIFFIISLVAVITIFFARKCEKQTSGSARNKRRWYDWYRKWRGRLENWWWAYRNRGIGESGYDPTDDLAPRIPEEFCEVCEAHGHDRRATYKGTERDGGIRLLCDFHALAGRLIGRYISVSFFRPMFRGKYP